MDSVPAVSGETSSATVISESANVVVQRLTSGSPIWNLTATEGEGEGEAEGETEGESKDDANLYNLPSTSSLLTEAQIQRIGQALTAPDDPARRSDQTAHHQQELGAVDAPMKTGGADVQLGFPMSKTGNAASCDSLDRFMNEDNPMLGESDHLGDQLLLTASNDSLKLEIPGVLDLSGESLETCRLLEEVINSNILTGDIKSENLDVQVAATAVVTTSEDGDTSAGEGIKQKGRGGGGGRKKQSEDEKAVPLRRSGRHRKMEEAKAEIKEAEEDKKDKSAVVKTEVQDEKPSKVKDTKETSKKAKRTKVQAEKLKHSKSMGDSEDGDGEDTLSQGSDTSKEVRKKRSYRKRKQSKEDPDEDINKTLKQLQIELKMMQEESKGVETPKEGHQLGQEGSHQGSPPEDALKRANSQSKDTRRRSEDGQASRSDHTYERRRSGSTSETAPSLFTPDNAVFIKLGSPKEGEGERPGRTMETRRRDRVMSWSQLKNKEDGELSPDDDGDDNDSDWTSDDDPEKLWCICRKPHDNRFMICCDQCEEWYHGSCVNITKAEGKRLEREKIRWICPVCIEKDKRDSKREMKNVGDAERKDTPEKLLDKPQDKPQDKPGPTAKEKPPEESAEVKVEGSEVAKSEVTTGKSPELPSTKKKRLKFYKPPPPKQHCIGPGCQSWARPGSIYCSSDCIVRHARQSIRVIHQEKEKSLGSKWRRDSTGSVANRSVLSPGHRHEPERIPVLERHTGKVRTGLSAPIQDQVYDFLERHPSYEVLRPGTQHGVATFYSTKTKPPKDKKEEQIVARVREREREQRSEHKTHGRDSTDKPSTSSSSSSSSSKEKASGKEKTTGASSGKEKTSGASSGLLKERPLTKEQAEKNRRAEEQAKEGVRRNVRESLRDMLATRVKGAKDLKEYEDQVKKKAYVIEYELHRLYNNTGSKYKSRYRSLFFNIKDSKNQGLFRRILKGEISAAKLVRMSSDQLASKELAEWREREAKHSLEMIVHEEEERKVQPTTKKTHKGEIEINDDNLSSLELHLQEKSETKHPIDIKIIEKNASSSINPLDNMLGDTTGQHRAHLFDLNCKICTGKMPAPREETVPSKRAKVAKTTTPGTVVEEEEEAAGSSSGGKSEEIKESKRDKMPRAGSVDNDAHVDVDDEDDDADNEEPFVQPDDLPTPQTSPIEASPKEPPSARRPPPSLWKGLLNMEDVAKFVVAGFHVSGPIRTISMDMPDNINICGRIPYPVVWDYFKQLHKANTTDLIVLRFHVVNEEDKHSYISLFQYFHSRQRIGVVGNNKKHIKDMYILPLSAHEPVPREVLPFKGPGLAEPRPHMLLGLMVRHRERARSVSLGQSARSSLANQQQQSTLPQAPHPRSQPQQQKRRFSDNTHAVSMLPRSPTDPEEFHTDPEEHELESKRFKPAQAQPLFIPQPKQWVDPIVAQYANADPAEFTAEPYSPTQEEIEAPYDPADVMDVIGEVSKVKGLRSSDESGVDDPMQSPSKLTSLLQEGGQKLSATEIADAASDVTANLLTAFSSKPDLTEQQQLLIKLTQQVEDAKKALLDRQIASLQSEIEKATSDSDFSPGHGAIPQPRQPIAALGGGASPPDTLEDVTDDQQGSPQIRRAPADSSTAAVEVGDDQGGATPTKDEQESKAVQSLPAKSDRSALDFIQSALFDSKAIPSTATKTTASVPPPINRTSVIPSSDPTPPFQGSYEPEYTPPSTAPAYNPTYNYNHYTPTQPASQVEEYQPAEQPDWAANRDYGHAKPGYSNEPYTPQEYNPSHHEPQYQQYNNNPQTFEDRQGYGTYNRGSEPASGGEGQGYNNWGQRYEGRDPRGHRNDRRGPNHDQDWRVQNRDYNRY